MATNTNLNLRNQMIYCIFVRDFTEKGTFLAVIPELDRIKALGTDIIWFLPHYPIGKIQRKGSVGSPYAIQDYRKVDENYGTMSDFETLVHAIHEKGMKVMIDIVYNHTSPDSWLKENHPEWFYRNEKGEMGNRVGDWSDIIDLDYSHRALWDYQIETLVEWAKLVDGFRCDVAPLVPLEFWLEARAAVAKVHPDFIWLSENIHRSFIQLMRNSGFEALSDSEIYQAFDLTYDYDVHDAYDAYLKNEKPLSYYVERLMQQETTYPKNYIKMRFLENHDNPRAKFLIPDQNALLNWTAFMFFQKGISLIYNGQEMSLPKIPSLFEREVIDWQQGTNISEFITQCNSFVKENIEIDALYSLEADDENDCVVVKHAQANQTIVGVFSLKGKAGKVYIGEDFDGTYYNVFSQDALTVEKGFVQQTGKPLAFVVKKGEV